jgi:hypothetical protein
MPTPEQFGFFIDRWERWIENADPRLLQYADLLADPSVDQYGERGAGADLLATLQRLVDGTITAPDRERLREHICTMRMKVRSMKGKLD